MRVRRQPVPEPVVDGDGAALRQGRLKAARSNRRWTELEQVDLVPRGHGLFVSAETDQVFRPYAGAVFATASTIALSDQAPLFYTVGTGGLAFFERLPA